MYYTRFSHHVLQTFCSSFFWLHSSWRLYFRRCTFFTFTKNNVNGTLYCTDNCKVFLHLSICLPETGQVRCVPCSHRTHRTRNEGNTWKLSIENYQDTLEELKNTNTSYIVWNFIRLWQNTIFKYRINTINGCCIEYSRDNRSPMKPPLLYQASKTGLKIIRGWMQ